MCLRAFRRRPKTTTQGTGVCVPIYCKHLLKCQFKYTRNIIIYKYKILQLRIILLLCSSNEGLWPYTGYFEMSTKQCCSLTRHEYIYFLMLLLSIGSDNTLFQTAIQVFSATVKNGLIAVKNTSTQRYNIVHNVLFYIMYLLLFVTIFHSQNTQ